MNDYYIDSDITSKELEERENKYICEWGTKYNLSNHNNNHDGEDTNRTYYRRLRDRILYSGGFRRLQDKTQVIAATKNGDHRTRLTHSLEVEQIATSMADALGGNKSLVSAIALGHDIGHTPFGHAVERFLNEKLKNKGGFSHAVQSVRYLKEKNINLSKEVFEGILKHDTDVCTGDYNKEQCDCDEYNPLEPGNLETQIVYWADKLAYLSHDFEDFYKTGIYENATKNDPKLERKLQETLAELIPSEKDNILSDLKNFSTRDLIRNLLMNLRDESLRILNELRIEVKLDESRIKEETKKRILNMEKKLEVDNSKMVEMKEKIEELRKIENCSENDKIKSLEEDIKKLKKLKKKAYQKGLIINFEDEYSESYSELRNILDEHYIKSPEVQRSDAKARKIVGVLYNEFTNNTGILPLNIRKKIDEDGSNKERIVADYIASMTDRYAEEVFRNLNSIGSYYDY